MKIMHKISPFLGKANWLRATIQCFLILSFLVVGQGQNSAFGCAYQCPGTTGPKNCFECNQSNLATCQCKNKPACTIGYAPGQNCPKGSYQNSCVNCTYNATNDQLNCTCATSNDPCAGQTNPMLCCVRFWNSKFNAATLNYASTCKKIENNNGALTCVK